MLMAISVAVPKNLSGIKTKVAMNLTKRQLVCFGSAGAVGIPFYIFTKGVIGTQASALIMVALMLPFFFLAMYEKDGSPQRRFCILCYGRKSSRRESVPINQKIFTDSWRRKRE